MEAIFSNRVEILYEELKNKLFFSNQCPFAKRLVIVPSPFMKSWLMLKMADDLGIACGFEVLYPEQSLKRLAKAKFPHLEIALKIEKEEEFIPHLKRLSPFCDTLARLFVQYAKYGVEMKENDWQKSLWDKVMEIPVLEPVEPGIEVYLFCVSHLPRTHFDFFKKMGSCFFQLSPCQMFWSDLVSDRQQFYWQEEYLQDQNPLLANFGSLGREMVKQIEESEIPIRGNYAISSSIAKTYEEFLIGEEIVFEKNSISLLEAIQADMLFLRSPDEKIEIEEKSPSVQIHVASSRLREVEILYNNLLPLAEQLNPGDILVMAPNIADYAPFVEMVFGAEESQLRFQLSDVAMATHDHAVQGFLKLFALPFSRWEASSLLELVENPSFQKKHNLSSEDVGLIEKWTEEAKVYWGVDAKHRHELLKRDHCRHSMTEEGAVGTWEHAFSRLLMTLVVDDEEMEGVETTQAELLGKWIFLVRSLQEDLAPFIDGTKKTLSDWSNSLKDLLEKYLDVEASHCLWERIAKFRLKDAYLFPFSTIWYHLEKDINQHRVSFRENAVEGVRFCSLFPMRAIPAKVVVLLGMQEGAFPRNQGKLAFELPKKDYCPTQTDYDRMLFLEALLSAREAFFVSYQGISQTDGQKLAPSLLVTELLDYCKRAFKGASPLVLEHPKDAFDQRYFSGEGSFKSYIPSHFSAAKAFYEKKEEAQTFISSFAIRNVPAIKKKNVTIDELIRFAKNPLRAYFQHTLGMTLYEREVNLTPNDEPFSLTQLQLYQLKKEARDKPIDKVFSRAHLPLGAFRPLAIERFRKEVEKEKKALDTLGVEKRFVLHFDEECQKKEWISDEEWRVPPLIFGETKVTGSLSEATESGLLVAAHDDRIDCLKAWPGFLLFCEAINRFDLPFQKDLLFLKSAKKKESFFDVPPIESYLETYFLSLENASPLIPEWTYFLVSQTVDEAAESMKKRLNDPFQPLFNPYVNWAVQEEVFHKCKADLHQWQQIAKEQYEKLYNNWYPRRGR